MQSFFGQFPVKEFFNSHRPLHTSAQRKVMMSVMAMFRHSPTVDGIIVAVSVEVM
jgi:hypothetical protein